MKPFRLKCGHPRAMIFDAKPGTGSWYCEYCFRFENDMRNGRRCQMLEQMLANHGLKLPDEYWMI